MISLRNVTKLMLTQPVRYCIGDKFMKERDEAAQKVYISRQQKQAMKKLLEKLSDAKQQDLTKEGEFERRLDQILRRYKITNSAFTAEVISLHKQF